MKDRQIDYNNVWKCMIENEGDENQDHTERKKYWDSKKNALDYLNCSLKAQKEHPETIEQILQIFPLSPEFRVLDIGSGSGRIAIPISERVTHVTAVEPGKGMMAVLKEQIIERGITNITTLQKRWEDIDVARNLDGPYDLVIASQSLGMSEISDAIRKMCAASRKWVYLMWMNGISPIEQKIIELWPILHGCNYHIGPRGNVLFNLLYEMKIYPNMKSEQREYIIHFSTIDDIVNEFKKQFMVSTPQQEEILKDGLSPLIKKTETDFIFRQVGNRVTLWWDVTEIDNN